MNKDQLRPAHAGPEPPTVARSPILTYPAAAAGLTARVGESATTRSHVAGLGATLQVLRLPEVCRVTGLCRSMVYQLEAERRFPRRVKISARSVGWIDGEVQAWLEDRIENHRARR